MSDYYSIQEVGGAELARHYPDRGVLAEVKWHKATLTAGSKASGWRRFFAKSENFIAVLSANADGLRMLISLDDLAVFMPWSEVTVAAERSQPATSVILATAAVPTLRMEFHLDDEAADELFAGVIEPLPQRDPPARLFWPKPWALALLIFVMLAASGLLVWLRLSGTEYLIAAVGVSMAIWLIWQLCRPIFEEER